MLEEEAIPKDAMRFVRSMDMCYEGQGHYVEVPVGSGNLGQAALRSIVESFHSLHRVKYGHQMDAPPKTINVRMKAIGKIKEIPVEEEPGRAEDRSGCVQGAPEGLFPRGQR